MAHPDFREALARFCLKERRLLVLLAEKAEATLVGELAVVLDRLVTVSQQVLSRDGRLEKRALDDSDHLAVVLLVVAMDFLE
jgi:hypothetical protein